MRLVRIILNFLVYPPSLFFFIKSILQHNMLMHVIALLACGLIFGIFIGISMFKTDTTYDLYYNSSSGRFSIKNNRWALIFVGLIVGFLVGVIATPFEIVFDIIVLCKDHNWDIGYFGDDD